MSMRKMDPSLETENEVASSDVTAKAVTGNLKSLQEINNTQSMNDALACSLLPQGFTAGSPLEDRQ